MKFQILIGCLLCLITFQKEAFQITDASTHPNQFIKDMTGSLRGGTTIYLKGVGFST